MSAGWTHALEKDIHIKNHRNNALWEGFHVSQSLPTVVLQKSRCCWSCRWLTFLPCRILGDSSVNMTTTLSLLLVLVKTTKEFVDENPHYRKILPCPDVYSQRYSIIPYGRNNPKLWFSCWEKVCHIITCITMQIDPKCISYLPMASSQYCISSSVWKFTLLEDLSRQAWMGNGVSEPERDMGPLQCVPSFSESVQPIYNRIHNHDFWTKCL